jgi:hypothetical protein
MSNNVKSPCCNPSCPRGRGQLYNPKGMALHLRNSVECRGHISFENIDRAHDRLNLSVQGYVDLSQSYHLDGYAFNDDDIEANAPTVSHTTEQRSMVKLMKLLDDMEAPDFAVESIIKWAQTALSEGFDFRPKRKSRRDGNLVDVLTIIHSRVRLYVP